MERLTERTNDGILVKEDYGENALKTLYSCYGAEPNPHYNNCEEGYCAMNKLAEYEDLEEQGKLLKLPCAVGDAVYAFEMAKVVKLKVIEISIVPINGNNIVNVKCKNANCFRNFLKEEFGAAVFLTREEAEAALQKLNRYIESLKLKKRRKASPYE